MRLTDHGACRLLNSGFLSLICSGMDIPPSPIFPAFSSPTISPRDSWCWSLRRKACRGDLSAAQRPVCVRAGRKSKAARGVFFQCLQGRRVGLQHDVRAKARASRPRGRLPAEFVSPLLPEWRSTRQPDPPSNT